MQLIFQSLPNHFIDHNARANTGIKRVNRTKKRKRDDMVAVVFDADASAFPFRTDNNSNWTSEVGGEDIFPADFRAVNPQAVLFKFFDGVFKIGNATNQHISNSARAGSNDGFVDLTGAHFWDDNTINTRALTGADDGTKIMRVLNAVK